MTKRALAVKVTKMNSGKKRVHIAQVMEILTHVEQVAAARDLAGKSCPLLQMSLRSKTLAQKIAKKLNRGK